LETYGSVISETKGFQTALVVLWFSFHYGHSEMTFNMSRTLTSQLEYGSY